MGFTLKFNCFEFALYYGNQLSRKNKIKSFDLGRSGDGCQRLALAITSCSRNTHFRESIFSALLTLLAREDERLSSENWTTWTSSQGTKQLNLSVKQLFF